MDEKPDDPVSTDSEDGSTRESEAAGPDEAAQRYEELSPAEREERLRQEASDNWNKYLRAAAELENLRKRASRDLENARRFGVERLVTAILPVRDSIEAGLTALDGSQSLEMEAIVEGERATLRLLDQALEASGICEIDPLGAPFDPTRHEAMTVLEAADAEPDSVLEVVQKGYLLHERLLRPARVVVSKAPAAED